MEPGTDSRIDIYHFTILVKMVYNHLSGQRQYMEKPKRTGGGGRMGQARKDEGQPIPLDPVT